ncbi:MAG: hypothetical protein AAFX03_13040 [Pseudomonadota bacterium]
MFGFIVVFAGAWLAYGLASIWVLAGAPGPSPLPYFWETVKFAVLAPVAGVYLYGWDRLRRSEPTAFGASWAAPVFAMSLYAPTHFKIIRTLDEQAGAAVAETPGWLTSLTETYSAPGVVLLAASFGWLAWMAPQLARKLQGAQ